jgi:3-hydroxyacyl-[acyl-carrier-protein] dehydratase
VNASREQRTVVEVPATHPCLAGHFPGRPLLPAVLLLELAAETLRARLGAVRVTGVPAAKFLRPLGPGEPLRLDLRIDQARGRAAFRYETGAGLAAQGELSFSRVVP